MSKTKFSSYSAFKAVYGDLGITEYVKYQYIADYEPDIPVTTKYCVIYEFDTTKKFNAAMAKKFQTMTDEQKTAFNNYRGTAGETREENPHFWWGPNFTHLFLLIPEEVTYTETMLFNSEEEAQAAVDNPTWTDTCGATYEIYE